MTTRVRHEVRDTDNGPILVLQSVEIENALEEYRERRLNHEAARKYTVVDDAGVEHNAGMFRDNTADVLEELSDAHNIAAIGLKRLILTTTQNPKLLHEYSGLIIDIEAIMVRVLELREQLPDWLKEDMADILREKTPNRIVTLQEVGL